MSSFDSVVDALDLMVEPFSGNGDWDGILRRAGVDHVPSPSGNRRRRRHLLLVGGTMLILGLAATAFATGLADRFSSWIGGTPGTPAPARDQEGFDTRNSGAFAEFPRGTKLRLLLRRTVAGTTFSLLGFRDGDTYCLRLIRSDHPGAIGRNQCLRAAELHGSTGLVVGSARFDVGSPTTSIDGVYGFAADNVQAMLVTRMRSSQRVRVADNVFLALTGQPAGSAHHHPRPDQVVAVHALTRSGTSINVPYSVDGLGVVPGGRTPTVPSYFAPPAAATTPGPTTVSAPIEHARIGWLARREKVGAPLPSTIRWLEVSFGRVVKPDPTDPSRFGVALATPLHQPPLYRKRPGPDTCLIDYQPLARRAGSSDCFATNQLFARSALMLGGTIGTPITTLNGLAADGIRRIEAFLSSGRIVRAALRDNVFAVSVPQVELPARLVGYDRRGRVAAIQIVPGSGVAKPCPPAPLTTPLAKLPQPQPWERIDLATMRVSGNAILGRTPAQVEAALGPPTVIRKSAQIDNGVPIPEFRYGGSTPSTMGLSISFGKHGTRIYARELDYQSPSLVDVRLGHILREQPARLQQEIDATYGSTYRSYLAYGGDPTLGCTADFRDRHNLTGISIGLNPYRPSRPYLILAANGGG